MLYQEYVGHDNNRDGYMLNMLESRVITKATLETQPLIFYTPAPDRALSRPHLPSALREPDFRQHAPADAAVAEPHRHRPSRSTWTITACPVSMHQETFDVWYPGYIDNIGNFRHTISFFTETALYRYATPHFYTVDDFPNVRQGLGTRDALLQPVEGRMVAARRCLRYMYGADHGRAQSRREVSRAAPVQQVPGGARHHREVHERAALRLPDPAPSSTTRPPPPCWSRS